jgi:peroxiredoxin Q/BCP
MLRTFFRRLLGGPPSMLVVGAPAPDFALPDHRGGTVTLSALRGRRLVLWFYPKADTPG